MCTVSFLPHRQGYQLGMNRDEQRTRVKGLFGPAERVGMVTVVGPSEPTGGRWIACNSRGVTFALLNWYAKSGPNISKPYSRGDLLNGLASHSDPGQVMSGLREQALERVRPFRLVMVVNESRLLYEWRWAGEQVEELSHPWAPRIWASSGYDEPAANEARKEVFDSFVNRFKQQDSEALYAFHGSHLPEKGARSVCMHRKEAATVSFTEVSIFECKGFVRYVGGPPCESDLNAGHTAAFDLDSDS